MLKSYLSKTFRLYSVILCVLLWIMGHHKIFYVVVITLSFLEFIYRRKTFSLLNDQIENGEIEQAIIAPINGQVMKIQKDICDLPYGKNITRIKLRNNLLREFGIYLPIQAEVKEFVLNTAKGPLRIAFLDYKMLKNLDVKNFAMIFLDCNGEELAMEFRPRLFGPWPKIWMMPGDRGTVGANIGHFPLGGRVSLYLPRNYEILTQYKANIVAAQSIIAALGSKSEKTKV